MTNTEEIVLRIPERIVVFDTECTLLDAAYKKLCWRGTKHTFVVEVCRNLREEIWEVSVYGSPNAEPLSAWGEGTTLEAAQDRARESILDFPNKAVSAVALFLDTPKAYVVQHFNAV